MLLGLEIVGLCARVVLALSPAGSQPALDGALEVPREPAPLPQAELGARVSVGSSVIAAEALGAVQAGWRPWPWLGLGARSGLGLGAFERQWGLPFVGVQLRMSLSGMIAIRRFTLGVGTDVWFARSSCDLGCPGGGVVRLRGTDQLTGHVSLRWAFGPGDRHGVWIALSNDVFKPQALVFGGGTDKIRTGDVKLGARVGARGWALEAALGLAIRSPTANHDRRDPDESGSLAYEDDAYREWSSGWLFMVVGVARETDWGELGFDVQLGPDVEGVRTWAQDSIHRLLDQPTVPSVGQPPRFGLAVTVTSRWGPMKRRGR